MDVNIAGVEHFLVVLNDCGDFLLDTLVLTPIFFASLIAKRISSQSDVDDIESHRTPNTQIWGVIKLLKRRGPRDFAAFLDILRNTGQAFIANKLVAELKGRIRSDLSDQQVAYNIGNYVKKHETLFQSLSEDTMRQLQTDLVLREDFAHQTKLTQKLRHDIEELSDSLSTEQSQHAQTRDELNMVMEQLNGQLRQTRAMHNEIKELNQKLACTNEKLLSADEQTKQLRLNVDRLQTQSTGAHIYRENTDCAAENEDEDLDDPNGNIDMDRVNDALQRQQTIIESLNELLTSVIKENIPDAFSDESTGIDGLQRNIELMLNAYNERHTNVKNIGHATSSVKKRQLADELRLQQKHLKQLERDLELERKTNQRKLKQLQQSLRERIKQVWELEDAVAALSSRKNSMATTISENTIDHKEEDVDGVDNLMTIQLLPTSSRIPTTTLALPPVSAEPLVAMQRAAPHLLSKSYPAAGPQSSRSEGGKPIKAKVESRQTQAKFKLQKNALNKLKPTWTPKKRI